MKNFILIFALLLSALLLQGCVTVQACETDDAACWRQKAARAEEARQDAQQQLEEARQKAKQQREDCIMETGDYERC
jgi:hypothetical protein